MYRLVQRRPQDAQQRGNPEQGRVAGNGVGPASSARARQLTPEALKKAPKKFKGALLFCDSEGASTVGNSGSQRKEANMSGYGMGYELFKERQARLMREAEMARLALSARQVKSLPSALKSLLLLLLPLN